MIQRGEGMRLLFKACGERRVVRTLGREEFERDEAIQGFLPRLVNDAHAATAKQFDDFELGEMRGEFRWREHRHGLGLIASLRGLHHLRHQTARAESAGRVGHVGSAFGALGGWRVVHTEVLTWP